MADIPKMDADIVSSYLRPVGIRGVEVYALAFDRSKARSGPGVCTPTQFFFSDTDDGGRSTAGLFRKWTSVGFW